jgi:hypothetical protein
MKTKSLAKAKNKAREIEPFDKRNVTLAKFPTDLSPENLIRMLRQVPGNRVLPPFFQSIETISVTKTVGRGRTNLTLVVPTVVQADATIPRASFDRTITPSRRPATQVHFAPAAYGITTVATYFIEFRIEVFGQGTFNLQGNADSGTVLNAGTKQLSGQTTVTLVLQNVPPAAETFAFLEQTAGAPWNWFATRISFPPIVITQ